MDFAEVVRRRRMVRHFTPAPVGVVPVGHPAPDVRSPSLKRGRRPLETVVRWERW